MKHTLQRILSLLLTLSLLLSVAATLPLLASAEEEENAFPTMIGDIYVDGTVSTKDGIYLLQYLANMVTIPDEHLFAANTHVGDDKSDGTVVINTKDAILLLQYLAKMNVQLGDPSKPLPTPPLDDAGIAARLQEV